MKEYDIVVVGTGAGGATVAYKCVSAGWKVAIIDSKPFGGTCALRGCDPKKVLIAAAEVVDSVNRFKEIGIKSNDVKIDWTTLMQFKRSFTGPVPRNREEGFVKSGIDIYHGKGHFIDKNTIEVDNNLLKGNHFMIASGSRPRNLNIAGEEYVRYSDDFLEMDDLPASIIFVGGGYISFEFANISAKAGAEATILHRSSTPLKRFDQDLVKYVLKSTEEAGIKIKIDAPVTKIEKTGNLYKVYTKENGEEKVYEAECVIHGAGRVPDIDDLDLEKIGVEFSNKGIMVNKYQQSVSNSRVFAAGDVTATEGFALTPIATMEAHIAAHNIIKGNEKKSDYKGIPTVVFTMPPLASVGLTEKQARDKGYSYRVVSKETSNWYTSKRLNIKNTGFKVVIDNKDNKLLGAHICGPHSEEVINLFAQAIVKGLTPQDIRTIAYAYPTASSDIAYMVG